MAQRKIHGSRRTKQEKYPAEVPNSKNDYRLLTKSTMANTKRTEFAAIPTHTNSVLIVCVYLYGWLIISFCSNPRPALQPHSQDQVQELSSNNRQTQPFCSATDNSSPDSDKPPTDEPCRQHPCSHAH